MLFCTQNIGTYDTLSIKIDYERQGPKKDDLLSLMHLVKHIEKQYTEDQFCEWHQGRISFTSDRIRKGGMYVESEEAYWFASIGAKNLKLQGSVTKNMFGTNLRSATLSQVIDYLQDFSFYLGVNLLEASIERVDTAANLSMSTAPRTYFGYLGEQDCFTTATFDTSKYWNANSTNHNKLVYDKKAEREAKREHFPSTLQNCNVLRPENRYESNATIGRVIGVREPILMDILTDDNYILMVNKLQNEMSSIPLQNNLDVDVAKIGTYGKAFDAFLAYTLQTYGEEHLTRYLALLREDSAMGGDEYNRKAFYQLRSKCRKVLDEHRTHNSYTDEWIHKIEAIEPVK